MSNFYTLLTSVGAIKLANATALGTTVKITEMAVGDGNGSAVIPTQEQTALVNEVRRDALNTIDTDEDNPNWVVCEQVIPADEGGWTIREVGVFDADGDLIAVSNFPETYKPVLSEGSGRTQTIRIILEVSSADSVELKIDPGVVLGTREYVDDQIADLKDYVDTQDKSYQTAAKSDATKKANQALADANTYSDTQDASILESAKSYADTQDVSTLKSAKSYADTQDASTLESAKSYADTQDATILASAKSDATTKANSALSSAKSYADTQDATILASAKSDATTKANSALSSAKSYADTQDATTLASAKSDATSKADSALSSAKSYADTKDATTLASAKSDATSKANSALSSAKSYAASQDTAHVNASDPHTQYLNEARFNAKIESYLSDNPQAAVGQLILVPATAAPSGYLKANGAALSRSTYASLWAYAQASGNLVSESSKDTGNFGTGDGSSTFTVPDLRGEFFRGWDDGRGVDADREIGSSQQDAFKSHTHTYSQFNSSGNTVGKPDGEYNAWGYTNKTSGATGDTETRPRNIALLACIKY